MTYLCNYGHGCKQLLFFASSFGYCDGKKCVLYDKKMFLSRCSSVKININNMA